VVSRDKKLAVSAVAGASSIPLARTFLDDKLPNVTRLGNFGKPSSLLGFVGGGGALALALAGEMGKGPMKSAETRETAIAVGAPAFGTALIAALIEKFAGAGGAAPQAAGGAASPLPGSRGPVKQFL
jgi:hypothetical protein